MSAIGTKRTGQGSIQSEVIRGWSSGECFGVTADVNILNMLVAVLPGIRYILSGELTFTEGGIATVYKAGDCYFETGNLAHTAENKTDQPLRILIVEILPKDWTGPAVIPPSSQ